MKRKQMFLGMAAVAIVTAFTIIACSKDHSDAGSSAPPGKQNVSLYLTDDPGFFDHVYIDIKSVQVMVDTCKSSTVGYWTPGNRDSCIQWEDLNVKAGVYDLLTLSNGVDTLLAQGTVTDGKIKRIKIVLGTNNSLVKDSVTYPLNLLNSNATILLDLKGNEWEAIAHGSARLWLDFDVARSIIRVLGNKFFLKPVLHCFVVSTTGSIQGKVLPRDAFPVLSIYNGSDTAYALPNWTGQFKVRGLKDGTYSVFINASNGYSDTTITNVSVSAGKTTQLPSVTLHK